MELRGEVRGIAVYDDFAHHPTAIASTIDGLRRKVGSKRIVAVLEPRSATMRMGVHRETLAPSLAAADSVWMFAPPDLGWDADAVVASLGSKGRLARSVDELVSGLAGSASSGDQVLIMSNGGFGGLHGKLLEALAAGQEAVERSRVTDNSVIALFPLHTVLFPGGPLPLRIFETRYTDMVRRCMREQQPFGVVMIQEGDEAGEVATTATVGCTARIVDFHTLHDGLLGISCVGERKFRVLRVWRASDGLNMAEVAWLPVEPELPVPAEYAHLATTLRRALEELAEHYEMSRESSTMPPGSERGLPNCCPSSSPTNRRCSSSTTRSNASESADCGEGVSGAWGFAALAGTWPIPPAERDSEDQVQASTSQPMKPSNSLEHPGAWRVRIARSVASRTT